MFTYKEFLVEAVKFDPEKKISGITLNTPIVLFKKAGKYKSSVQLGSPKGHVSGQKCIVTIANGTDHVVTLDMSSKESVFERLVEGNVKNAEVAIYDAAVKSKANTIDTFGRMSREKPFHFQAFGRDGEGCMVEVIFK